METRARNSGVLYTTGSCLWDPLLIESWNSLIFWMILFINFIDIVYKCLHGQAPAYLSSICIPISSFAGSSDSSISRSWGTENSTGKNQDGFQGIQNF